MSLTSSQVEYFMGQAIELAEEAAQHDEVPVGAVLVRDRIVIGRGRNRREETRRTIAHAEIVALEDWSATAKEWRVPENTSLVSTVEPCLMCTGALLWARVSNIYYGCKDNRNAGILRISDLISLGVYDHRFTTMEGGYFADRCAEKMSQYFRKKRG